MTARRERAEDIRSQWLSDTVRECQALLRESLHTGPNRIPAVARDFLERLAQARTPLEQLVERGLLLEVAIQFGHAAHNAFHRQYPEEHATAASCTFLPASALEEWPRDLTRSPAEAFRRWAGRYAASFRDAHPLACARDAEHYIRQHFRTPVAASDLARRLDCPTALLRRTFHQLTGTTLLQYQSALRAQTALHLLTHTDWKMEAIAQEVGYHGKKDLYRVVHAHAKCTPLEWRRKSREKLKSGKVEK
jgi:transcriptional regulator GlxA family with amidase domain